jgi:hypothetical protein
VAGCYEHGKEFSGFITGLAKELLACQEEFFCICLVMLQHVNSLANLRMIVIVRVGLHIMEATRNTHLGTPHSVGLPWTSDQPHAETST